MPEKCPDCNFESEHGFCLAKSPDFCGYTDELLRPDWCPLVEIPNKHGRLIDAFKLLRALIRKEPFSDCARVVIAECMEEIRQAPTVIEAEG